MKVASALEELTQSCLDNLLTSVLWIFDYFEINFGFHHEFKKRRKKLRVNTIMVRYLLTSVPQNFDDFENIKRLSYLNLIINSNEKKEKDKN